MNLFERIKLKLFEILPSSWYILYKRLTPSSIRKNYKWLHQRITRGWDDRDLWDVEYSFYIWLQSHLKSFIEKGYANDELKAEINIILKKLDIIIYCNLYPVDIMYEDKDSDYNKLNDDVFEWLKKNLYKLWN